MSEAVALSMGHLHTGLKPRPSYPVPFLGGWKRRGDWGLSWGSGFEFAYMYTYIPPCLVLVGVNVPLGWVVASEMELAQRLQITCWLFNHTSGTTSKLQVSLVKSFVRTVHAFSHFPAGRRGGCARATYAVNEEEEPKNGEAKYCNTHFVVHLSRSSLWFIHWVLCWLYFFIQRASGSNVQNFMPIAMATHSRLTWCMAKNYSKWKLICVREHTKCAKDKSAGVRVSLYVFPNILTSAYRLHALHLLSK